MSRPPAPPANGEWVIMGRACVDSGSLAVIDPCYVIGKGDEIYGWENYDNLFEPYCDGLGVQFFSGYGDGLYEVWAYIVDEKSWGKRVAQVTVCMIDDSELEEEL